MSEGWEAYTDDLMNDGDDQNESFNSSSYHAFDPIINPNDPFFSQNQERPIISQTPETRIPYQIPDKSSNAFMPQSAPTSINFMETTPSKNFHRNGFPKSIGISPQNLLANNNFYKVQFHLNHIEVFSSSKNQVFKADDFVITEADRGIDIGRIMMQLSHVSMKEIQNSKKIIRLASPNEISQLRSKSEKELNAIQICQEKADQLLLPMHIIGSEFQFDGKKLTFYFTAPDFVDFRDLVKVLFRIFKTRIWMVWHDGNAPIKDVIPK